MAVVSVNVGKRLSVEFLPKRRGANLVNHGKLSSFKAQTSFFSKLPLSTRNSQPCRNSTACTCTDETTRVCKQQKQVVGVCYKWVGVG